MTKDVLAVLRRSLVLPGARATRTFATTASVLVLGLLTSILLARWLGPSGRGEVAAAMLWPALLIYLASFGLIHSMLYHGAQSDIDAGALFGTAFLLALVQSAIAVVAGYFALPHLLSSQAPDVVAAARLYLLVIPLSLVGQYAISLVQARMHFSAFNALRLIIPIGYFAGICVLDSAGRLAPISIVVLHLGLNFLTVVAALVAITQLGIVRRVAVDRVLARQLTRYGGKVWVGGLSQAANLRLDQGLLSALFPPAALGIYITAVSVAGLLSVLANSVQMVATPMIANRALESERRSELQRLFRRFWVINVLAALALAAASPLIIPLLYGKEFAEAIVPAMILIVGAIFIGAKDVLAGGAQALGDPWLGSRSEIISMIVTVALLLALLPPFGIIGAAAASTIAYFTQFAVVVRGLSRRHGIGTRALVALGPVSSPAGANGSR